MKDVRFGIVGCGTISKWHADAIALIEGAVLAGVTDNRYENALRFAQERSCVAFESYEAMLESDKIDAVCICTPSGLHAEMAVMAAKAGKHFAVEKPLALTREGLDAVVAACEESGVKGAVISQNRFAPSIARIRRAIEEGLLGKLVLCDLSMKFYRSPEYYASAAWRGTRAMDGGALMNQGIHGIDLLNYLAGPVQSVHAVCRTLAREIESEDTACMLVTYENGAIGTVTGTTSVAPGYPLVLSLHGTAGSIVWTDGEITKWDIAGQEHEIETRAGGGESYRSPNAFSVEGHFKQLSDLVCAIREGRTPAVDVHEGRKPVDIILAAYRSEETKKTVFL